ncbi:hypothetical protein pf16_218 [Pseudomonas phage pf16]|uniref:Uncharacterized protein n=1 Tax=Pseudomonas phage pf16 TaxID=1815630 RepID=A0A1S5R3Z7_9CAUD|nr:hypothetical protein FDG98_gp080 [Pseudomonas phage pf16]AND75141.1 hypothetical protein pf16_218 [Pseudomonas phage pf16]
MSDKIKYIDMREEPPAGSGKIVPMKSKRLLLNIRDWLIQKLAGDRMIIINAHIAPIPRDADTNIVGKLSDSKSGALLCGSYFYCSDVQMLQLTNYADARK